MLKKASWLLLAAALAPLVWAADATLRPGHPTRYTVQQGDTLWDISARFLAEPWRWPEVWKANPQVRDPDLIYPGDTLVLTVVGGRPVITLAAGEVHLGGRNYKRSPVVRDEPHLEPVRTIPLDAIQQFLDRPVVLDPDVLELAPYVVSSQDEHLVAGPDTRLYVRDLPAGTATRRYTVVRPGRRYVDPDYTGDRDEEAELGQEALYVGDAVLQREGDPATLLLTGSRREVLVGDRLIPQEEQVLREFFPRPPSRAVDGRIIGVIDAISQVGQYQVVVLNRGGRDGLEPGHVLSVLQATGSVRDDVASARRQREEPPITFAHADANIIDRILQNFFNDVRKTKRQFDAAIGEDRRGAVETIDLPDEKSGHLMVFRVFDRVSYALTLDIARPVHLNDAVQSALAE